MFKKITNAILLAAVTLFATVSCEKAPVVVSDELEVNANNISGQWELVSMNGNQILEGSSLHMEFIRNDKKFVIEDGMEGFAAAPKISTGRFDFEENDALGVILIGIYDHDNGFWNDKYIVSSLTKDTLTLTGVKSGLVQVFHRMAEDE